MLPFQIKICGITKTSDATQAAEAGADAIGLNFYPPSPRFVDLDAAEQIIAATRGSCSEAQSPNRTSPPKVIGVFVNKSADEIARIAEQLDLDGIQLHGDEPYSIVGEIKRRLPDRLLLRAIRVKLLCDDNAEDTIAAAESEIEAWASKGIHAVLLDAAVAGEFGGTGHQLDWHAVARLKPSVPLILAGGLTPGNVDQAIRISNAQIVDVASGVESHPGQKDHSLVKQFVDTAKTTFAELSAS